MSDLASGFLLLVIAGIVNANFATPMKYTRRWAWENTWLIWTVFTLLLLAPAVTILTVPHLGEVYRSSGEGVVRGVALSGAGWGVAQVLFGLAIDSIGIALTFSIVMGISAALGSLLPMLHMNPGKLNTPAGHELLVGLGIMLAGVAMCAWAGRRRERALHLAGGRAGRSHTAGIVFAVLCGIGSSLTNFGFAFGEPIALVARRYGASPIWAVNAIWLPLMTAGALPSLIYCLYLLRRNHTGGKFPEGGIGHWVLVLMMAIFWLGSTLLYGAATVLMGTWGPILGWPLLMSLIVISASVVGILTGEWRGSGKAPLVLQLTGVALLIIAVFVLTNTNRYFS